MRFETITVLSAAALVIAYGCSSSAPECRVGADCASGACDASGKCVSPGTGTPVDASTDGAGAVADGSSSDSPITVVDSGLCTGDADGTITRAEMPIAAGLRATYLIGENATFDTTGAPDDAGTPNVDLTVALSGDYPVIVSTEDVSGTWYASSFQNATYASKLSDTQDLLGVFHAGDTSLVLLGVVSPASGATQTNLAYAPSVQTLVFPIHVGATWSDTSNVTGTAQGVIAAYSEKYESHVDVAGTLKAPLGTFQVLRVATLLTRTVGVVATTMRTYTFVAECFGTVAQITSQSNEPNAEFTSVAEVRRLSP